MGSTYGTYLQILKQKPLDPQHLVPYSIGMHLNTDPNQHQNYDGRPYGTGTVPYFKCALSVVNACTVTSTSIGKIDTIA